MYFSKGYAASAILATITAVALLGCETQTVEIPPTHPVHGRVVFSDGTPLTRGMVHLQSLENRQLSTMGEVDADGRFVMNTFVVGKRAVGAIEGSYRVTILPALPDKLNKATVIRTPVLVTPGENELTFTITHIDN